MVEVLDDELNTSAGPITETSGNINKLLDVMEYNKPMSANEIMDKIGGVIIMRLLVIRHGQTDWNLYNKVMGRCDEPLNREGLDQAEEIRSKLLGEHIDLIICSPLKRARETAEVINKNRNIKIIFDDRIEERDFGEFEGHERKEFDWNGFWDYYKNDFYERAENIQDLFKRVYSFLDDIILKYNDKNVLLVTHGGISVPIRCYFSKSIPDGLHELIIENCQVISYDI